MILPHLKTIQDIILERVNLEDADLFDYERPLWKLPTEKRPSLVALCAKPLKGIRSILP